MLGYHASHEQFAPSALLEYARLADERGFEHVLASDHFHPWSERQGESGFVYAWLGAAMGATAASFGTVTAPGYRYHPGVVAQAAATLAEMYEDRFWLCLGSGQLLNEGIAGERWPPKDERNARLEECVEVIRRLFAGEEVTHRGRVTVERARLHTRPDSPPRIVGAALSEETARWIGEWADAMITVASPDHEGLEARVEAFRETAGDKPVYAKVQLSYDESDERALDGAHDQWRTNCVPAAATQQFRTPEAYDELAEGISKEQVAENVRVSADLDEHVEWLRRDREIGVDRLLLHNVNREQERFIEDFAEGVLPEFA